MLVLVVEDLEVFRKLYKLYFQGTGIDVHFERSVAGAIEALMEKQFAAVITDRLLKAGDDESSDGEEVVKAVRELQPGVPVLMVSDQEGYTAADGFVNKHDPNFPAVLIPRLFEASRRHLARAIFSRTAYEVNNMAAVILGNCELVLTRQPGMAEELKAVFELLAREAAKLGLFANSLAKVEDFRAVRFGGFTMIETPGFRFGGGGLPN